MGLKTTIVSAFSQAKFFTIKHSPEICMVAGTIELVCTVISACKATTKFQKTIEKHNARLAALDLVKEAIERGEPVDDDLKDIKKARQSVYADTVKEGIKCYAGTACLAIGTALTYFAGMRILNGRLVAASGLAAQLIKENRELEKRCEEKYGIDTLKDIKGVGNDDTVIDTHVDEETGEEVVDGISHSDAESTFSIWFDAEHPDYRKIPGANKEMLLKRLNTCQRRLEINKHLFYNEALRIFGYDGEDLKDAGQIYGWTFDKNNPTYIDCGIRPGGINEDFYMGRVNECLLMFNVNPRPIIGACGFGKKNTKIVPVTC